MSWLSRLTALFRKRRLDADLDDELRFHLEMEAQQNLRAGMAPDEARRQARLRLGGLDQVKESYRDRRGLPFVENLFHDLRSAVRSLLRTPGVTAAALLTLTLGIGIGTTIYSLVHAVLLRPLPYEEPDRLVVLWSVNPKEPRPESMNQWIPVREFLEWRNQTDLFEGMAAFYDDFGGIITSLDPPESVAGSQQISPGLLRLLGVQPWLGRTFTSAEERSGAPVLLLQYELWQRRFQGDPNIVGKTLRLRDRQWTIIGVMPQGFQFFSRTTTVFLPLNWGDVTTSQLSWRNLRVIARLKAGVTLEQAQNRVNALSPQFDDLRPSGAKGWRTELVPVSDVATVEFRPALLALSGASLGVLLIMCANLANLLLVKANGRARELAVRAAMGASRGRIVRILLTESLLLSAVGCLLGLGLCANLLPLVQAVLPGPRSADYSIARLLVHFDGIGLDGAVAMFAVGCSLCSGLVFGLLPAIRCSRPNLEEDLKDVGHGSSGHRAPRVIRVLAVAQVAVSIALVVGAVLLTRSVVNLYRQGPGFQSQGLLRVSITWPEWDLAGAVPGPEAPQEERQRARTVASHAFMRDVFEAVQGVPGVESVAEGIMVGYWTPSGPVAIEGSSADPWTEPYWASNRVTPNYFATMGIPLLSGRTFDTNDRPDTVQVVIINREAAERFWPSADPVGKRIRNARRSGNNWLTIIGVVGDVRIFGMDQPPPPTLYYSDTQWSGPWTGASLIVKTDGNPNAFAPSVIAAIRNVNPSTLINEVRQVQDYVDDLSWRRRLATRLLAGLGALALVLATVGVYGVLSHAVSERTREIGIRMALGADRRSVIGAVLRQGLAIAGLGLVVGLALAAILTRFLVSLMYGVEPLDTATFAISAAALLAAALVASYLPARRAARVDPMTALRCE